MSIFFYVTIQASSCGSSSGTLDNPCVPDIFQKKSLDSSISQIGFTFFRTLQSFLFPGMPGSFWIFFVQVEARRNAKDSQNVNVFLRIDMSIFP